MDHDCNSEKNEKTTTISWTMTAIVKKSKKTTTMSWTMTAIGEISKIVKIICENKNGQ